MNSVNKLYTLSYFKKRLRNARVKHSNESIIYKNGDDRKWTISVSDAELLCTCFKNGSDYWFVLWDCGKGQLNPTIIRTQSMNVMIDTIKSMSVSAVNKNKEERNIDASKQTT